MAAGVPGGTAPHVGVDDVEVPILAGDDRHHLERALRLRAGDRVSVTDGAGRWRWCRFGPELVPDGPVEADPPPSPPITVAFALVKGERPELVVQKLTEVGVDRIVPFFAERSVVRWDEAKAARHHERLVRIAREAAMQCRRTWWPEVVETTRFEVVAALPGAVAAERHGAAPSLEHPVVLIGPEGGWSDEERGRLPGLVGLGPTVLRAETAAIAAGVVLSALRSAVVRPVSPPDA
ncbi:RsmE family RNA methyltransferase [Rhabdothermincola salaria]|uniref:RsmE family RNA methyltransferase n=1 Tax=Rhabdothermincola salaria TaxID=2903142 RepID=UPI001E5E7264|nr:RsmE family RNA methyltransferase [Rhabdothermincola salaria]MCD9622687.1 16S rRNA (uracil(1498)-N(3))-methyltransferase [Rhabdothermincola salaria]